MKHYIHHVPGRIRVRMPSVKGSAANARTLESAFRSFDGVQTVSADPLTGSLLIHYDPATVNMDWVAALVPGPQSQTIQGKAAGAVTGYLVQTAIEKALFALIAAVL